MRTLVGLIVCLVLCVAAVSCRKNFALLIAGSAGYSNYRHQADICHAYQIMHKAGIPDEQIVVMMYDDIANNEMNPFKGNIINRPNGPNVYPGVLKDYAGHNVNAQTMLAALQGNKTEVKRLTGQDLKVIDSGPDDYIFVYYADHGGPGILGTPKPPYLKATDINKALKHMFAMKKYAKMVFYIEACESGSIFSKLLPKDINVYATTAANPEESSYGCYYDQKRQTYLGDTYSVKWMEDTDKANLAKETFETQFKRIKRETHQSHVQQYGDMTISKDVLDKFYGNNLLKNVMNQTESNVVFDEVPSEMVKMQTLKNRLMSAPVNSDLARHVQQEMEHLQMTMSNTNDLIWDISSTVYSGLPKETVYDLALRRHEEIQDFDMYYTALDTLLAVCPGVDLTQNDYVIKKLYVLVNLCNHNHIGRVISAIEAAATASPLCR